MNITDSFQWMFFTLYLSPSSDGGLCLCRLTVKTVWLLAYKGHATYLKFISQIAERRFVDGIRFNSVAPPPQTVLVAIREIQVVKLQQTLWLNTLKWAKVSQRKASSKRSKAKWRRPDRDASMTLAGVSRHHAHWWICTHVELNWNLSNALNCWAAAISADLWYLSRL